MEETKKKRGRPKKENPEDLETIKKLASKGLTRVMIADFLEIDIRTFERNDSFCRTYKKYFCVLGARVRTTLIGKMDKDTIANIYLDKVINKTSEKFHDDNLEIKKLQIEIDLKRLELEKLKQNISSIQDYEDDGFVQALEEKSNKIDYTDLGDYHD